MVSSGEGVRLMGNGRKIRFLDLPIRNAKARHLCTVKLGCMKILDISVGVAKSMG